MDRKLSILMDSLKAVLGEAGGANIAKLVCALDEVTIEVPAAVWSEVALALRDDAALHFESCLDVCGVDYSTYKDAVWVGHRFAAVYHFLSYKHNVRLRVRVFCTDDDFPVVPSMVLVWPGLNWFEREAFDLALGWHKNPKRPAWRGRPLGSWRCAALPAGRGDSAAGPTARR